MKRSEFADRIVYLSDLISFCIEEDCPVTDELMDADARDECIDSELMDYAREESWYEVQDWLNSLSASSEYDFWRKDEWGDWIGYDDSDIAAFEDDVIEWMDDHDQWDPEDDEEEEEEEVEEIDDPSEPEEEPEVVCEVDVINLMSESFNAVATAFLQQLRSAEAEQEKMFSILEF